MQSPALARSTIGSTGAVVRQRHRTGRQHDRIGRRQTGRRIQHRRAVGIDQSTAWISRICNNQVAGTHVHHRGRVVQRTRAALQRDRRFATFARYGQRRHYRTTTVVDQRAAERIERTAVVVGRPLIGRLSGMVTPRLFGSTSLASTAVTS